jgi:hypothetical protein
MLMIKPTCVQLIFSFVAIGSALVGISGCEARIGPGEKIGQEDGVKRIGSEVGLTLTGYNYTDKYIDEFSVNSLSGGNLYVSDSVNGGGGSTCCVGYITGVEDWKIPIRFHVGSCTYDTQPDSTGKMFSRTHNFYKTVEVQVDKNIPPRPSYFEVHIYPDNHVEAVVTEKSSSARLILSKDREDKSPYKQCPNDRRPEN